MKLTESKLRTIIREELKSVLDENTGAKQAVSIKKKLQGKYPDLDLSIKRKTSIYIDGELAANLESDNYKEAHKKVERLANKKLNDVN